MEADKRVYCGSTYADFMNWENKRLMLKANESIVAMLRRLIFINLDSETLMRLESVGWAKRASVQIQRPVNLRNLWPQSP